MPWDQLPAFPAPHRAVGELRSGQPMAPSLAGPSSCPVLSLVEGGEGKGAQETQSVVSSRCPSFHCSLSSLQNSQPLPSGSALLSPGKGSLC